ncbi:MFS transporter [Nocardia crassostreae]|uniref:MFS transporter n=1 Tax=Nocardia crassostreae TaxID=53428 RepID=UPI000832CA36|nr:MFS transporter [Nocardia crassostreae]
MDDGREVGSWRALGGYWGAVVVLAGGVLVGAVNIYLAASLLPTAVEEIGGERVYAWATTVFLVAQVIATLSVGRVLSARGGVGAYLVGFGVFALGSVVCAVSPAMPILLVGRGIQGLGAGLLIGLGFALIYSALPQALWVRGSAVISAMFGAGNFAGPALGGLFAQFGSWRAAFAVLAVAALAMAVFVPRALPAGERQAAQPIPVASLLLLVAAAAGVSVAGVLSDPVAMAAALAVSAGAVVAFVAVERRARQRVLPRATYLGGSPLRWVYLSIVLLASGVAVEIFLPLFGQRMAGLAPLVAGFLGAALSFGWSVSQIVVSSVRSERVIGRLRMAGPILLAGGFAGLGLLQWQDPSLAVVIAWAVILIAAGAGIGIAMPHLSVGAMTCAGDPEEGRRAAASVATVLTMSTAFGAAIAGLLVNLGDASIVTSARYLLFGFAGIAALGVWTAVRVDRSTRTAPPEAAYSATSSASESNAR